MDYWKIVNWKKWQTYRSDRGQPPWIKIHRRIMRNPEWVSLTDSERGQLVAMWLLAADHDGVIPASEDVVEKLCFMSEKLNINKFIDLDFISDNGVKAASYRRQHDVPEAKAEEEKNKDIYVHFDLFWQAYPKKVGKGAAKKAWKKIKPSKSLLETILIAIKQQKDSDQWQKDKGQFIPMPSTWLNQERWEDEVDGDIPSGPITGEL